MDILVRFAGWMAKQGYTVEITKPLHDRSRYYAGGEDAGEVVKPDFEGKVFTADGRFARSYVVEVMGFSHALYRAKKGRLKAILTRKPGRYLEHQAHDGIDPAEGDRRFRKDLLRFGKSVIDTPPPRPASTPTPAVVPLPPAPLPALPPVLPPAPVAPLVLPVAPVLMRSAISPAPAEVSQRLFGTPAPWPIAASTMPALGASSQPPLDDGNTLGRLAHRLLTALGIKR